MRLLSIMNRTHLLLIMVVLIVWTGVLFFVMQWEVYDNIDEVLQYRKTKLVQDIRKEGKLPANSPYHDFQITLIDSNPPDKNDSYQDTLLYKSTTSFDEYRRITSYFEFDNSTYRLRMILPHLEEDELIDTLAYTLPLLAVMILLGFSIANWQINKRAWRPFYQVIEHFKTFSVDKGVVISFDRTSIKEFKELQAGVKELMARNVLVYEQQKQFTENASHEIHTPLGIIQSKIELLFQQQLTRKQGEILSELYTATTRLSKINETLLLLTRIENNQFADKSEVEVRNMVDEVIPFFDEHAAKYQIKTRVDIASSEKIYANSTLLSILVTNLLKNAFIHNKMGGEVTIRVENKTMRVINTGDASIVPVSKVFDRFFTERPGRGGLGLGLAIVKSICQVNNWDVDYHQHDSTHEVAVRY